MKKALSLLIVLGFILPSFPLIASAACSPVALGGTGWCNFVSGAVIYGNGTSPLATTTAGTNGQFLSLITGIPTWATVSIGGATSTNPLMATYIVATSTTVASQFPYASTTAITASGSICIGGTCYSSIPSGANPTTSVGLTAINGSASTFLRSDGAPALSQTIAPTMTGLWAFANTGTTTFSGGIEVGGKIATPYIMATSTATSTFAGGLNITGTDCFAQQGTCLQTFIQNATAYKQAVSYATAAVLAGTPTYANGVSGVGATLTEVGFGALVVDGQNPTIGQRVLIKDQAAQLQNGIYTVTAVGSGIAAYVLTRATDYNTSADIYAGTTVPVLAGGNTNGDTQWTETTTGTITVGTTAIAFEETAFGTTGPTSVSNADGTLTISPTTGAVVASIALGHSNIWSALQLSSNTGTTTFSGGIESGTKIAAPYFNATSSTATSTFNGGIKSPCFSNDGIACLGSGSGTVGSGTTGQLPYYAGAGTTLTATSTIFLGTNSAVGIGTTTKSGSEISLGMPGTLANPIFSTILDIRGGFTNANGVSVLTKGASGGGSYSTIGVLSENNDGVSGGIAIKGVADNTSGSSYGLYGQATNGVAVYGTDTGTGNGVQGQSNSATGVAVYALQGSTGYGLYSTGGINYLGGNTGVSSTTPWGRLSVKAADTSATSYAFVASDSSDTVLAKLNNAGLFTLLSATTTNLTVATSFQMPNSSNPSPLSAGYLTMSTNSPYQLHVGNGAGGTAIYDQRRFLTFNVATSTTWTGTSTTLTIPVPTAMTFNSMQCKTDAGTLNVQVSYGQPATNLAMVPASTTMGTWTWTTNNTPPAATTTSITVGTPASSPTTIGCTISGVITGI